MSYSVTCQCGSKLSVSATQAGARLKCGCGRMLEVPLLSALRRSAGENPIPINPVEQIRAMLLRGELPDGNICPYSGRPANDTIYLFVQCERTWVRGGDSWSAGKVIGYVLLLGWLGVLLAWSNSQPLEEVGRDTSLELPLRISSDVREKVLGIRRQSELKSLLASTPVYAKLLEEFPEAVVSPMFRE